MSIDIKRLRRILAQEGLTKTAGSGDLNAKYLASIPAPMKAKILKAVANHYGTSISEIEEEVTDKDAEALYEYIPTRSMAVQVLRDMKGKRFASYDSDPGDVYASAYESAEEALSDMETALESSGWRTSVTDSEWTDDQAFEGKITAQKGRDKAVVYVRTYLEVDRNGDLVDDVDYFYALWDAKWWDYQNGDEQEFEDKHNPKKMAKEMALEIARIHARDGSD